MSRLRRWNNWPPQFSNRLQCLPGFLKYSLGGDRVQAGEGVAVMTFLAHARNTGQGLVLYHVAGLPIRACAESVGGAKERDDGTGCRGGYVHRAGVVGDD